MVIWTPSRVAAPQARHRGSASLQGCAASIAWRRGATGNVNPAGTGKVAASGRVCRAPRVPAAHTGHLRADRARSTAIPPKACRQDRVHPPLTPNACGRPWARRLAGNPASRGPARRVLLAASLLTALACALPAVAQAQELTLSLGDDGSLAVRSVQLIALMTLLSLVPGLAIMITCFPFIVTVLAILRQAIGLQQSPPSMLLTTLAIFLTWFVMEPVFAAAWEAGVEPLNAGDIGLEEAFLRALEPFRIFMAARIDADTFANLAALRPDPVATGPEAPLSVLVPSFLLSELARAFEVGFLIFLPFLIIDLVVAAVLMSMGMMMVPPVIVSLPFKLAFFVVADGWSLVSAALVTGYF